MLVVSFAVASPALFGAVELLIPRYWWITIFVLFLATLLAATAGQRSRLLRFGGYAIAVISAWVIVLTAPGMGLLLVLLVVTAATSVYVVPLWAGLSVVVLNTIIVVVATASNAPQPGETVIFTGFYLLIQLASLLSSATLLREQRMRRELAEANVDLQAAGILLSESARTAERLRISRELHDLIGHQLTVLTLELETARHLEGGDSHDHLERADRVARELLRDVRATVGQLRTQAPDLEKALSALAAAAPGLDVKVEVSPRVRLDEEESAVFVRAAQEIVTNTLRHADAHQLWFEVTADSHGTALNARDDGRGASDVTFGNGLEGLRERFVALGGEMTVSGSDGFRVTARVPSS